MDPATRALDRADRAIEEIAALREGSKEQLEAMRLSWARDMAQNHEHYSEELRRLDKLIRGDGNGIKGLSSRISSVENESSRVRNWIRLIGAAVIGLLAKLAYDAVTKGGITP